MKTEYKNHYDSHMPLQLLKFIISSINNPICPVKIIERELYNFPGRALFWHDTIRTKRGRIVKFGRLPL